MKRLSMIVMCLLTMMMVSPNVKAQEITITLNPGWNWIGYTKAEVMDIATALGSFTPVQGDMIKSQQANASYSNGQWRGSLQQFTPGLGYHYYSNRTETVSFIFDTEPICPNPDTIPEGAICGKFTIDADGDQVYFSQGNLQYIGSASTPYWKFAENQWDYLGTNTEQNSGDLNVDRDLFAWGTSGWDNGNMYYHPYNTEAQYPQYDNGIGYGPTDGTSYTYNLTDVYANSDWGVYNPILNGGNVSGLWRTLTKNEWQYILSTRSTPSGIRYAKAIVNGANGIILLPDNWDTSIYSLNYVNAESASFNTNEITLENWLMLETEGVVFLPAAGMRFGWSLTDAGAGGYYWSTSHDPDYIGDAYSVSFGSSFSYGYYSSLGIYSFYRMLGFSVRLVRNAE